MTESPDPRHARGVIPPLPSADEFVRWGIDPAWSKRIVVTGADGVPRSWHVLERAPDHAVGTVVCVHGNPTWAYYWRTIIDRLGDRYRVIAIDQLGMGFSERTPQRRYAQRVADLADVLDAMGVDGPVVLVAHDWGGAIAMGWAVANADRVQALVLCNTGIAVPAGRTAPRLIKLAASGWLNDLVCRRTRGFVDGTLLLSGRRVARVAREAYRAPYRRAADRRAIAEFVADVPFRPADPSAAAIDEVAGRLSSIHAPVLLVWGASDPVFDDDFAYDLAARLPQADRHRFRGIGHLVVEEADVAAVVDGWLADGSTPPRGSATAARSLAAVRSSDVGRRAIWSGLDDRRDDHGPAFVDGATNESTSFAELHSRVHGIAAGLAANGVSAGDRVAVLVPPGVDLLATVYACWRAGAVTVIADRGLGLRGLGGAVRAAHVQWVVGPPRALAAARLLRWAPRARSFAVGPRGVLGAVATLDALAGSTAPLPPEPAPDALAAVLYTSGATGPAKGVRYRHAQMAAQRDALASLYSITVDDRLVAAFAPFALYGPALGITSTIPDVDVTRPGSLTAGALAAAVSSIDATIVFASPAALANVNRTATASSLSTARVRLVLSAGAPVPIATLRATSTLFAGAELHTPYGMTECLPVADISLSGLDAAGAGEGVCVGRPVDGVTVLIAALGFDADVVVTAVPQGASGEVLVHAPWVSDGYDQLWRTEHEARPVDELGTVWHRTGDVGHVDADGRLWIEGRSVHVVQTAAGAVTPVPVEVAVQQLDGIDLAAAVGVGPLGCQQLVVVVEDASATEGLCDGDLAGRVRAAVAHPVAAVLSVSNLPVDIRHNTKIDRALVARWTAAVLAGRRAKRPW